MKKEEVEDYLHQKIEKGETVSPILPDGIKNYLIDIDGTICDDVPNEEPERMVTAKLYPDALVTIIGLIKVILYVSLQLELKHIEKLLRNG